MLIIEPLIILLGIFYFGGMGILLSKLFGDKDVLLRGVLGIAIGVTVYFSLDYIIPDFNSIFSYSRFNRLGYIENMGLTEILPLAISAILQPFMIKIIDLIDNY